MKKITILAGVIAFVIGICAFTVSTTVLPYFTDASKRIELSHYTEKDKYDGYSSFEFLLREGEVLTIKEKVYNKDGKFLMDEIYTVEKKNNATQFDLHSMIGGGLDLVEKPTLKIEEQVYQEFPDVVKVGDVLKNATLKGTVFTNGQRFCALELNCINRKVVEVVEIVTPSGKYESYCVEFTFTSKIGFVKSTDTKRFWFNDELGIIKTDRHDKKGKYTGKSELTKVY